MRFCAGSRAKGQGLNAFNGKRFTPLPALPRKGGGFPLGSREATLEPVRDTPSPLAGEGWGGG